MKAKRGEKKMTYYSHIESPIGKILLIASESHLLAVAMEQQRHGPEIDKSWEYRTCPGKPDKTDKDILPLTMAAEQLEEYFSGKRKEFSLPVELKGTEFQRRVWQELSRIPYGESISYGELARRVGSPKASRAVGLANGRNPITIIIPCHRVIGADGRLTGYGGGLPRKKFLLDFEAGIEKKTTG